MTAIAASSVAIRTMADGTLRASIDFEPRDAAAAFALLGSPGQPLAVTALKTAAQRAAKPAGGALAKLAGQWCNDATFRAWCGAETADDAAEFIRRECGIASRAELDSNKSAEAIFHLNIRSAYASYLQELKP